MTLDLTLPPTLVVIIRRWPVIPSAAPVPTTSLVPSAPTLGTLSTPVAWSGPSHLSPAVLGQDHSLSAGGVLREVGALGVQEIVVEVCDLRGRKESLVLFC